MQTGTTIIMTRIDHHQKRTQNERQLKLEQGQWAAGKEMTTGFFSLFSFYSTNEYIKNRLRRNREGDDGLLICFFSSFLKNLN